MRRRSMAWFGALALACGVSAAADYPLPEEFVGSYLANRASETCLRQQRDGQASPMYLVIQSRSFRYGYMNPDDGDSLDAMVCRATAPVAVTAGQMDVPSECFMTDRLVQRHFQFTKRAGVLWLHDVDKQTTEEFAVCL